MQLEFFKYNVNKYNENFSTAFESNAASSEVPWVRVKEMGFEIFRKKWFVLYGFNRGFDAINADEVMKLGQGEEIVGNVNGEYKLSIGLK